MTIDTRWFQNQLTDRKLSQRQLAKKIGLDPAAVSLMFRGKRRMQMTEAADVARMLGVPLDEVLKHAGIKAGLVVEPELRSVPLVYWIDGHAEMHALEPGHRIDIAAAVPDDVVAAQCRTAMTAMEHMDRWLLLFSAPKKSGVQPDAVGRYSVAKLPGGMMTIGHIRHGYTPGKYAIHRGGSVTESAVEWAAPVLLIQP